MTKSEEDYAFERAWEYSKEDLSDPDRVKYHLARRGITLKWREMTPEQRDAYLKVFGR